MENQITKSNFVQNILNAAAKSPDFRKRLIENPKSALEYMLKFKLPTDTEIVVHEDTPKRLNIVLPYHAEELSEVELSAVSGGVCWDNCDCG